MTARSSCLGRSPLEAGSPSLARRYDSHLQNCSKADVRPSLERFWSGPFYGESDPRVSSRDDQRSTGMWSAKFSREVMRRRRVSEGARMK
jgi:hypothetical protein